MIRPSMVEYVQITAHNTSIRSVVKFSLIIVNTIMLRIIILLCM